MEIGQVAIKNCGRESMRKCVVVDIVDDNYVLIDGNVKRRKCNILHLEPLEMVLKIKKNASANEVHDAMKKAGIEVFVKRKKEKVAKEEASKEVKEKKVKKKNVE